MTTYTNCHDHAEMGSKQEASRFHSTVKWPRKRLKGWICCDGYSRESSSWSWSHWDKILKSLASSMSVMKRNLTLPFKTLSIQQNTVIYWNSEEEEEEEEEEQDTVSTCTCLLISFVQDHLAACQWVETVSHVLVFLGAPYCRVVPILDPCLIGMLKKALKKIISNRTESNLMKNNWTVWNTLDMIGSVNRNELNRFLNNNQTKLIKRLHFVNFDPGVNSDLLFYVKLLLKISISGIIFGFF